HFEERSRSLNPASNVDRKEEPNVERFVRDPRIIAYDLCWDRCRTAYDGRGVTGAFGNGRRHRDRGGLESALQRERRAHADRGERNELERRARAAMVVGRGALPDEPRKRHATPAAPTRALHTLYSKNSLQSSDGRNRKSDDEGTAHASSANSERSRHIERHLPPRRRSGRLRVASSSRDPVSRTLRALPERCEEARCNQGGALAGPEED